MRKKSKTQIKCFPLILAIIILALIIFTFLYFQKNNNFSNIATTGENTNINHLKNENTLPDTTFTMTAIGDVMCHNTQYWDAYNKDTNTYDFSYVFENVKDYIQAADVSIANIETSFAGEERRLQ